MQFQWKSCNFVKVSADGAHFMILVTRFGGSVEFVQIVANKCNKQIRQLWSDYSYTLRIVTARKSKVQNKRTTNR